MARGRPALLQAWWWAEHRQRHSHTTPWPASALMGATSISGTPAEAPTSCPRLRRHDLGRARSRWSPSFLLARALRWLWLPIKALALNVVSLAAAYGATVLIWQEGFGCDLLFGQEAFRVITHPGLRSPAFALLFGLLDGLQSSSLTHARGARPARHRRLRGSRSTNALPQSGESSMRSPTPPSAWSPRRRSFLLRLVALPTVPAVEVGACDRSWRSASRIDAVIVQGLLAAAGGLLGQSKLDHAAPAGPALLARTLASVADCNAHRLTPRAETNRIDGSDVDQARVDLVGAGHDELLARCHVVAHQQLEDLCRGVQVTVRTRRRVRNRGSIVVSASWSASISPRPLYRWGGSCSASPSSFRPGCHSSPASE